MSDGLVSEGRALLAAKTPGVWYAETEPSKLPPQATHGYMIRTSEPEWPGPACVRLSSDASLIVWLRNNAAALLDAYEANTALRAEVERLRAEQDQAQAFIDSLRAIPDRYYQAIIRAHDAAAERDEARAAVQRVRALHWRQAPLVAPAYCVACDNDRWPCPTVAALDSPAVSPNPKD